MEPFRPARGVTLIELLVVLGIITILMSIIMVSQGSFNRTLTLANTAYDVALTVRSTETLGLGSSNAGYGVHFAKGATGSFVLFGDTYPSAGALNFVCHPLPFGGDVNGPAARPGDCAYKPGYDQTLSTYTLGNGITIKDFCAKEGGSWSCAHSGVGALTSLDIVFSRPNVQAFMTTNGISYHTNGGVTAACILLTSPQGGARAVTVGYSGEIVGNGTTCPSS